MTETTFDKKKCWKLKFVRDSGSEREIPTPAEVSK